MATKFAEVAPTWAADGIKLPLEFVENVTAAQIIVGNASNRPTAVAVSGDAALSNAGAVTINPLPPSRLDRATYCHFADDFLGAALNVTDGRWKSNTVQTGGTPTVALVADTANGEVAATLEATDEVQRAELYWGDQLVIASGKNPIVTFRAKFSTIGANEFAVVGLASARNNTYDDIAANAWFRLDAAMDILVESDDGTTDTDDTDTAINAVADTYLTLKIDLSDLTAVVFTIDGTPFATTLDLTALTGNLQPFVGVGKASGTGTPAVTVDDVEIQWER